MNAQFFANEDMHTGPLFFKLYNIIHQYHVDYSACLLASQFTQDMSKTQIIRLNGMDLNDLEDCVLSGYR